jgi:uncharacterized membrane protein YjgN (DUF898 family)
MNQPDSGREIHFPQYVPPAVDAREELNPPPLPDGATRSLNFTSRFQFSGNATEYFGIWISNLLLTIITIGFYAPWAKVRRLRYFYGHTSLAELSFDFTGIPSKILIGRLIAVGFYFAYGSAGAFAPKVAGIILLVALLVMPWLVRATLRFNARNSKYSNSRFYFSGSTARMYGIFFLGGLASILSMGLLFPYVYYMYKRYQFDHLHLGQLDFKLTADVGAFYAAILIPFAIFFGGIMVLSIAAGIMGVLVSGLFDVSGGGAITSGIIFGVILFYLALFSLVPMIQARLFITTWKNVQVGRNRFDTNANQWRFTWIVLSNWLARIFSVGLLTAWAAIRIYKYKLESLSIQLVNSPDELMTLVQKEQSAFAEELTDILDIDISL